MASYHYSLKSGGKGTARDRAAYIRRDGKYRQRDDLIATQHGNLPDWAEEDPAAFWKAADAYERENAAVYREHEIALPNELSLEQNCALAEEIVRELVGTKPYEYAIHGPDGSLGGIPNLHLHAMYSDRVPDEHGRSAERTFARHNREHPERGGCRKDSGGREPRALREEVIARRQKVADLINHALAEHGFDTRVDHRSLREQGIARHAERHLGPARIKGMSAEEKARFVGGRERATTP